MLITASDRMTTSKIDLAKPQIVRLFNERSKVVFNQPELAAILKAQRTTWGLSKDTKVEDFIVYLTKWTPLKRIELPFAHRTEIRYAWKSVSILQVLASAIPRAYFTHHTAARLHKLTSENLGKIYINYEQSPHERTLNLAQESIDRAFSKPQRMTNNIVQFDKYQICLLNGMNTRELGVHTGERTFDRARVRVRFTNLERTLIDLTVRPAYAGGPHEVLRAFRNAKSVVSTQELASMLDALRYVYPYHQAIGFYLEASGYSASSIKPFRDNPVNFDFYLAPGMSDTEFVSSWRLHVPRSILNTGRL